MEEYIHKPLSDERNFRILLLCPSRDPQSPLFGDLKEVPVSDDRVPSSYEALSYVWGSQSAEHYIQIDGKCLTITPNCKAALIQLRRKSKTRALWVDSICIDQRAIAVKERNVQVARMGIVFSEAIQVFLWLGEGNSRTDSLFKFVARSTMLPGFTWVSGGWHESFWVKRFVQNRFEKVTAKEYSTTVTQIFLELATRPWFERMWTLQELLLSTNPVAMCGQKSVSWKTFHSWSEGFAAPGISEEESSFAAFRSCWLAWQNIMDAKKENTSVDLQTLLELAFFRKAQEPCDKIFALYSIAQTVAPSAVLAEPDYERPVAEIYTEATAVCLQNAMDTTLLEFVWSKNRRTDLPSWVPDWSDENRRLIDHYTTSFERLLYDGFREREPISCRFSENGRRLHLDGFLVGTINSTSVGITPGTSQPDGKNSSFGMELSKAAQLGRCGRLVLDIWNNNQQPTLLDDFYDTIKRLAVHGTRRVHQNTLENRVRDDEFTKARLWEFVQIFNGKWDGEVPIPENDWDVVDNLIDETAFYDTTFFTTSNGLFGFTFGTVLQGDKLVQFGENSKPFVLRPNFDEYSIESAAYVKRMERLPLDSQGLEFEVSEKQEFVLV